MSSKGVNSYGFNKYFAIKDDQTGGSIAAYSPERFWYTSSREGGVINNTSNFDIINYSYIFVI